MTNNKYDMPDGSSLITLLVRLPDDTTEKFTFKADSTDREDGFLEFYSGSEIVIGVPFQNVIYFKSSTIDEGDISDNS